MPYFTIGIVLFVMAVSSVPTGMYGSNLIDTLGRRKMALVVTPMMAIVFLLISYGVFLNVNVYLLYGFLVLVEPLMVVQGALDNAIIADVTTPRQRTDAYSLVRIMLNMGFALGPSVGGFVAGLSYGYIFLIPFVLGIIEFSLYAKYVPDTFKVERSTLVKKKKFPFPSKDFGFLFACLLMSIMFLVTSQWGTTLTLFWSSFDHINDVQIGILYGTNGLYVALGQLPTNKLLLHMQDHMRLLLGFMLYSFAFLGLAFFRGFYFLLFDVFVITMGENVTAPIISTIISKMAPPDRRGQYFGVFQVFSNLASPSAPVFGTYFLQYYPQNEGILWEITFLMSLVILVVMLITWKRVVHYRQDQEV